MQGLSIKAIIGLTLYAIFCFCISLAFVQCSEERAQEKVQKATVDAESANAKLSIMMDENEKLRDVMVRANDAVERAMNLVLEAQNKHEERVEFIESDPEAVDWLSCDLPDSVRDAFKDYCRDEDGDNPSP